MQDYESSHLASDQEMAVCGYVGRFMESKLPNDMIAKSAMPKA